MDSDPARWNRTENTFGETFGEARADTVESIFPSPTGRLRGQRAQLQKNLIPHPSALHLPLPPAAARHSIDKKRAAPDFSGATQAAAAKHLTNTDVFRGNTS
jgi:hypothetical protein